MNNIELYNIGKAKIKNDQFFIELEKKYKEGITGLNGFSHAFIIWWAHQCPEECRNIFELDKPYIKGPDKMGIFATRSPFRPNPLCISLISLKRIDADKGIIETTWFDLDDETPVLDIKPYHGSSDRPEKNHYPMWCAHWPHTIEQSGSFDWCKEIQIY